MIYHIFFQICYQIIKEVMEENFLLQYRDMTVFQIHSFSERKRWPSRCKNRSSVWLLSSSIAKTVEPAFVLWKVMTFKVEFHTQTFSKLWGNCRNTRTWKAYLLLILPEEVISRCTPAKQWWKPRRVKFEIQETLEPVCWVQLQKFPYCHP